MSDKHISSQFDAELTAVSTRVLEMGGLCEAQLAEAVHSLATFDAKIAQRVLHHEEQVNRMEIEIDDELSKIIARRQPTARDLRLLIAISKTTANLERVGDEAERIARMVLSMHGSGPRNLPLADLRIACELAASLLRKSMDAFARLDVNAAAAILREDNLLDHEFSSFLRILITYMMEDPRTISSSIDLVFVAKAIERVGDHAKNIAEFTIYVVKGADIRHTSLETIESTLANS